ncbi:MAG TPA: DMT family transporter, partial [Candidatus Eisenbacteria bacterium]|nr:DMT family transporter [Candidatus Eisenbacteria bacterium]
TAGTVLFKRWRPQEHLTVVNGVQLLVSGACLLMLGLVLEPVTSVRPDPLLGLSVGYLAVAVSVGAMSIWFFLLRSGDASRASSYFFLNPVFGLLLGWKFLSEPLSPLDLAGTAGVAVGLHLVQRVEQR